jgi:Meiotic cell cortex C-terminal pleckstrin homology
MLIVGVVTGVLDVKDDTPLMISPSSSQLSSPVHNRSIVVLTPTQAIKFTALSHERHISWLTALNFLVHNDPADLIIPRAVSTSPSNGSLWPREPVYAPSGTASSIASSHTTNQHLHYPQQPQPYGSYNVRKNSLPEFVPVPHPRDEVSPLGYKHRMEERYAIPPSVPRIPTGRRFESRERSESGSATGTRDWEDPNWNANRETIRMDAFVKRTTVRHEEFIDHNLFREF